MEILDDAIFSKGAIKSIPFYISLDMERILFPSRELTLTYFALTILIRKR